MLKVDDKFKDHYKIIIDGNSGTGKSSLINAVREMTSDSEGLIRTGENDEMTCYELGDNVVLCEMPNWIVNDGHFMYDGRYDNYDGVVILTDTGASSLSTEYDLMRLSKHARKPYLLVRSKIDQVIKNHSSDGKPETEEGILQLEYDEIEKNLIKCELFIKNKKPLLVDFHQPNEYDFKELKALIKEKDFSGNSIPPCKTLLEVPEKFKYHHKIIIDSLRGTGKSSLINALFGKKAGSDGFIPTGGNEKITFYEFGDNIVLCEMAAGIIDRDHFMCDSRYDNYDGVVILTDIESSYVGKEYDLMTFAKNANKPYLLVRSKIDSFIRDARFDGRSENVDDSIRLELDGIESNFEAKGLNKCEPILKQRKPLFVDFRNPDKYDFRELEALITSKDFSVNSLSN